MNRDLAYALASLGLGLSDYRLPDMSQWSWGTKSRGNKTPRSPINFANTVKRNRKANKLARKMRKNK